MPSKSSYYLMWGSITLLTLFLGYWLRDSYLRSKEIMKEKNVMLFSNAVREAEDSLLQWRFQFEEMPFTQADSSIEIHINLDTLQRKHMIFDPFSEDSIKKAGFLSVRSDSLKLKKMSIIEGRFEGDLVSSAAIIVRSIPGDQIAGMTIDTFIAKQIDRCYRQATEVEFPGISYSMIEVKDSNQFVNEEWITPTFFDPVGNIRYAAVLDVNFWDLIKQIWPQFLFSLFLLGITGYAFWMIHNSFVRQVELARIKDDFISNMTHELKTPISTVRVALEALENFNVLKDPNRTKEYLGISQNEMHRLQLLVDRVMNTSSIESADFQIRSDRIDLNEITRNVLSAFQITFDQEKLTVDVEGVSEAEIEGDQLHLTNVIYNLVDNAIKYGNGTKKLSIRIEETSTQLMWKIKDNGIGIARENQKKIFDKFYRVPSGNVHNIKGHGLGLYYVKQIMELHNGHIEFNSTPGNGTEFILTFSKSS